MTFLDSAKLPLWAQILLAQPLPAAPQQRDPNNPEHESRSEDAGAA